jgi:hypothetical protein
MSEPHDRIAALEAELAALKAAVGSPGSAVEATAATADGPSRRTLLRHLAVGAAGAAAAGAGLLATAGSAAAADSDPLLLGVSTNSATNTTTVRNNTTGTPGVGVAFLVQSGGDSGGVLPNTTTSGDTAALAGWVADNGAVRHGIYGYSGRPTGAGVFAQGQQYGAIADGRVAAMRMLATGSVAEVAGGTHQSGELIVTTDGDLWYCPGAGILRKVASAASAGQFHLLASPVRVYDSRTSDGRLSLSTRTIGLAGGSGGVPAAVPAGATGALVSLTADATTGSGYLAVFSAALAAAPGTSNLNWSAAGQTVAVTTVSAVDGGARVKVQAGGGGGSGAQVIVDVLGYYR